MHLVRVILSWILALGLIFVFLQATLHPFGDPPAGSVKLWDAPGENIVFQTLSDKSGIGLFEPAGRVGVAVIELFAALMLLLPWTRRFGAFIAACTLGAAAGLHLSPWLGREIPTSLATGAPGDNQALFMLAVAMFVASVLLIFVHPGKHEAG